MSQQHFSSPDDHFPRWNARERQRVVARHQIRVRVQQETQPTPCAASRETVQSILQRILDSDRSFFATHYLDANFDLLSTPFSTEYLFEQDGITLLGQLRWISWLGHETVAAYRDYFATRSCCTFLEYAVWLQRYHIVGSLLVGGVAPHPGVLVHWQKVPVTLQTYLVSRVLTLRRTSRVNRTCSGCGADNLQCLEPGSCGHEICEPCLWKSLTERRL